MAHGLETRSPFLDVELAEFVLGLPWRTRFGGGLKSLLKAACGHLWPESVRGRKKQGFGAPVRAWLQLPAVRSLWERVTRKDAALCALLPGLREAAAAGLRPQRQWTLLCLGLWCERRTECLWNLS
jgi:asparagine synthase (glutamine-hydrolysing)